MMMETLFSIVPKCRLSNILILLLFCSLFLISCQQNTIEKKSKDLEWTVLGTAEWTFDGPLIESKTDSGYSYIITPDLYTDFELTFDFKPDSSINSGVFVRCKNDTINPINCHEINIWDLHTNQNFRTGSIVTKCAPFKKVETVDKWNQYRIVCEEDSIKVWLNDVYTASYKDSSLKSGPIAFQAAGRGNISFRDIQISQNN